MYRGTLATTPQTFLELWTFHISRYNFRNGSFLAQAAATQYHTAADHIENALLLLPLHVANTTDGVAVVYYQLTIELYVLKIIKYLIIGY